MQTSYKHSFIHFPRQNCNEVINEETINRYYSELLYKEVEKDMEVNKVKKISIKSKKLLMAKQRLSERKLTIINEDNKDEYYESLFNDFEEGREYTWRAMDGKQV